MSGSCAARDAARLALERARREDARLGAFLRFADDVEAQAARVAERVAAGAALPLAGVPVAIKDNLLTAGLETTCASRILDGFVPDVDATAVARLRAAGAVVLGKTNMDEFSMGSSTEHSAFGPTRNPWDPTRVPGGSSGGSAAAVAAGLVPLALGSDTGGSIRQPAAFCGVVGLKPTYGRVSRRGLVAFGSSLDQVGPLAARVRDAAAALEAIAGADPLDATCAPLPVAPLVAACDRGVERLTIGRPREYLDGLDPAIAGVLDEVAARLAARGARLVDVELPHTPHAVPAYYLVATAEASSNLARYDGVRYGRREAGALDLATMYARTRGRSLGAEVRRRIMLGTFALSAGYAEQFYGRAQRVRTLIRRDFVRVFDGGVDALLAPATPTTAFELGARAGDPLEMYLSDVYTTGANLAGIPALVVPAGVADDGLPVGVQLLGPDFAESTLVAVGAAIEGDAPPLLPPGAATDDARST